MQVRETHTTIVASAAELTAVAELTAPAESLLTYAPITMNYPLPGHPVPPEVPVLSTPAEPKKPSKR